MQRVSVPKLAMAEVTKSGENRRKVATVPALVSMYQRTLKVSIEQELDPVGSTVRYEVMKYRVSQKTHFQNYHQCPVVNSRTALFLHDASIWWQ